MKQIKLPKADVDHLIKFLDNNKINKYCHYINNDNKIKIKIEKKHRTESSFPIWLPSVFLFFVFIFYMIEYWSKFSKLEGISQMSIIIAIISITIFSYEIVEQFYSFTIKREKYVDYTLNLKKEDYNTNVRQWEK